MTYDEALYCEAQMFKWRNQHELENDEIEMSELYRLHWSYYG